MTASEIEDLLSNPNLENPYTSLKKELIRRLSVSEHKKIKQLLVEEELGTDTPSHFLRRLKSLAGSSVQDDLLRIIWMQRLPAHIQGILQTQLGAGVSTESLAVTADKIQEVQPLSSPAMSCDAILSNRGKPTNTFSQNPHSHNNLNQGGGFEAILEKLSMLEEKVNCLSDDLMTYKNSKFRSQSQSQPSKQHSTSPHNDIYCWYHKRYGSRATKCVTPCTYPSTKNELGN
ncbi:uncharacterized protein LOC128989183 [Macrosteles quadrilineatus]|uniref:uncharacterized protein LOC128989183 n=1 Tax=Macrosteles quadrilineatus TaxID=74068 RepID=UPI0023E29CD5|nr:uncharacterized protein LOC128989183 [Macrosteles quadrilineatus]